MERMNFPKKLTILIVWTGIFYSVLFSAAKSFSFVLPIPYAWESSNPPWPRKIAVAFQSPRARVSGWPLKSRYCYMAWQSHFAGCAMHNNGHGESVLLASSLSVLIVLVVAAIFVAVHTDGPSKVSFRFQSVVCPLFSTPSLRLFSF